MAELKDRLQRDLTAAMKTQDELARSTLRMVLTAIGTEEVAGDVARELTDDEVLVVLVREAKKRREAAEGFTRGGATERAERELAEGQVVEAYLPAQLPDEELRAIVAAAVASTGASGPRGMGAVMKVVRPQVGNTVDGGRLAAAVKAALGA